MQPKQSWLNRFWFLGFALPPILVLILALLVFEGSVTNDADYSDRVQSNIASQAPVDLPRVVAELRARYLWFTGVLLDLVVSAYAIGYCCLVILRAHPPERLRGVAVVGACLSIAGLTFLALSPVAGNALFRMVYGHTMHGLEAFLEASPSSGTSFLSAVHVLIVVVNILAAVAPTAAVLAFCSIMAPHDGVEDLRSLARRMRALNDILAVGSALLVAGTLHMSGWLHWGAALVSDDTLRAGLEHLAQAITTFWGATFTLMIVTAYLPAAKRLHAEASRLIENQPTAAGDATPKQWLQEHGFSNDPLQRLPQMALMAAPLIAGPISSMLAGL